MGETKMTVDGVELVPGDVAFYDPETGEYHILYSKGPIACTETYDDAAKTTTVTGTFAAVINERDHLRQQVTELQTRMTEMVGERRNGPGAIRVKRLTETAIIPKRAHDSDSGLDLHADISAQLVIPPGGRAAIPTGIAVAIPKGYEGQVRPRSGLARKAGVATFLGTIDAGYRGDIGVTLLNTGQDQFVVMPGDRIAQLVVGPVCLCDLVEVDDLDGTERGGKGFGSSGVGVS